MAHHHHQQHPQPYGYSDYFSSSSSGGGETSHGMFELQAGMEMLGMQSHQEQKYYFSHGHHQEQQQQQMYDHQQASYQLSNSVYLAPAQELLNEFCSLGGGDSSMSPRKKRDQPAISTSSSSYDWNQAALLSLNFTELQKRKAKLLAMLEEVDRRYKKYSEQMRTVVASFETVAGHGSAAIYSKLASKAMSRHFRCLRDKVVGQIQATRHAMGEKDEHVAPGTTKGETPRLKLLDQCIRQQKSLQQAGLMDSQPWRPQRGLPERSVSILRAWLFEHFLHPYPSDVDKHILARQTGLSRSQVSNWFINARVRLWKPMVEEMYVEETKNHDSQQQSSQGTAAELHESNKTPAVLSDNENTNPNPNPNFSHHHEDQKPILGHLHVDSGSLTSLVDNSTGGRSNGPDRIAREENFGLMDLDFSSYQNDCSTSGSQSFNNGVSLTLGLTQHTGRGMSLSFSPSSHEESLFFGREQMEPVQFSFLDGEGQTNLPYRNLMGAQMLRDLAG